MKTSLSGTTIVNYTKYNTDDLVAIVDYVEDYKKLNQPSAYKPDVIVFDTYTGNFLGRRAHSNSYVKYAYGGSIIRLIDPKKLESSPVEQLATVELGMWAPAKMVEELLIRIEFACGMYNSMKYIPEMHNLRYGIAAEDKKVPKDKTEICKQRFLRKSGSIRHRISSMLNDLHQMQFEVPQLNDYGRAVIIQESVLEDIQDKLVQMQNSVCAARESATRGT